MPDYQRIIDEIRFHLQSDDCELTDELRELGAAFAAACREVNGRLRRCGEFLRQGLRSEAIHLAEAEPKLLELVTLLDFAERSQWDEIASFYRLPKPEPLLLEVAEALNEAYAQQQPLEQLLDRHRLLALSRAPLNQRLAVMRKLAELDTGSTFWDDDVREFERARQREIEMQAREAASRGDARTLRSLLQELEQSNWRDSPSKVLVRSVRQQLAEVGRRLARRELQRLEGELNAALGALDLARGRQLRDEWNSWLPEAQLDAADPLLEQAAPALGWIADEEAREAAERAFQKAVAALEQALNDDTPLAQLQELGRAAPFAGRSMPEPLASRYRNRVQALDLSETRRRRAMIGATIVAVLLMGGFVGLLISRNLAAGEARRIAATVEELLSKGQLADARALYDRHADLSTSDYWLAVQQRLADAERQEQQRAAEWTLALESAQAANSFAEATLHLEKARKLARSAEEKLQLARLEQDWQQRHQAELTRKEEMFRETVRAATSDLERLDQLLGQSAAREEIETGIRRAEDHLKSLRNARSEVPSHLSAQVDLLASRLSALQETYRQLIRKTELLKALDENCLVTNDTVQPMRRLTTYIEALRTYGENFSDARGADFKTAAAEGDLWIGQLEWQALTRRWQTLPPQDLSETRRRLAECESFLSKHRHSPTAAAADEYLVYLQSVLRRDEHEGDEADGIRRKLVELFSGPVMSNVYLLRKRDGTTYYLQTAEDFSRKTSAAFRFISGFSGETQGITIRKEQLLSSQATPAPQSVIAEDVRSQVPNLSIGQWDDYLRELTKRLLNDREMDPFLRYFLLLRTLDYAGEGNSLLAQELEEYRRKLEDDQIDLATRWMDPDDERARLARIRATDAVRRILDVDRAWQQATQREKELARGVFRTTAIVGWLKKEAGGWICQTTWQPRGEFTLEVIVPGAAESAATRLQIGTASEGRLTLGALLEQRVACEGRLVFAVARENPTLADRR